MNCSNLVRKATRWNRCNLECGLARYDLDGSAQFDHEGMLGSEVGRERPKQFAIVPESVLASGFERREHIMAGHTSEAIALTL